ncbi:type IV secretion system protein [Asticcacaulis sp.]|uniref:type IV secretion system protein n=1 Tax=Asticcacaulis sp. TaxID=1872648 RepID=UPI0031DA9549
MSFATEIEQTADTLLDSFVTQKSAALASALSPVALVAFSLYIIVMGYAAARGELREPLIAPLSKFMRLALVATLALIAGQYQAIAVEGFRGIESGLIQTLSGTTTVGAAIDAFMLPFDELSRLLGQEISENFVPDLVLFATLVVIVVAEILIVGVGLGYYLLAKVSLALILALGPAFILCAAFPSTQRFTESWIAQVLNFLLLNVLIVAAFTLVVSLTEQFAQSVLVSFEAGGQVFRDAIALLILCASLAIVMLNLSGIAMGLAGGVGLGGGSIVPALSARTGLALVQKLFGGSGKGGSKSASGSKGEKSADSSQSPGASASSAAGDSPKASSAEHGKDAAEPAYKYQHPIVETVHPFWRKGRSK